MFGVIGVGKGKEDTGTGCANTYPTPGRLSTSFRSARARMCRKVQAAGGGRARYTGRQSHKLGVRDSARTGSRGTEDVPRAIALAVQHNRPNAEVLLVPESVMDGQVDGFAPHVLVRNHGDGAVPEELLESVVCRVEVLYTDSMSTRVSLADGKSYTVEDASMDDLLSLVDEAEALASRSGTG